MCLLLERTALLFWNTQHGRWSDKEWGGDTWRAADEDLPELEGNHSKLLRFKPGCRWRGIKTEEYKADHTAEFKGASGNELELFANQFAQTRFCFVCMLLA